MSTTFAPDLDAYFSRIGYCGPREATLAALAEIHTHHVQAIPFENLDVLLGRGVSLDPAAIEEKLVRTRRGGYCFEQNSLFAAVLRALGFQVTPLIARVRWKVPADVPTPLTHMVLRIDLADRPWLADAGFGGMGLTKPIALDTEEEQGPTREPRRLRRERHHVSHQVRLGGEWLELYRFTLDEAAPIDFEVGNWFTSTHPQSRFRQNLIASRAAADRRFAILNREFVIRHGHGQAERLEIADAEHLLALLAEHFGLQFPPGTRFGPPGSPWPT